MSTHQHDYPDDVCLEVKEIASEFTRPKAIVAAMMAAAHEALAEAQLPEPSQSVSEWCPRARHYQHMAQLWLETAQLFQRKPRRPSDVECWLS